jgi:multimeric flavodoxin WrbA
VDALILVASPRRNGNSAILARAAAEGLRRSNHTAEFAWIDDHVSSFLRDCRSCRDADGRCSIDDGFHHLFTSLFLPARGVILATPLYWYGMSGQLKAFFDRMFCYVSESCPSSSEVRAQLLGKRVGLIVSSEETFPSATLGLVHQVQEYCRYTCSTLVDVVTGHGNSRGDVIRDPRCPLARAEEFGERLFSVHTSDYTLDTPRSARMWVEARDFSTDR